MTSQPKRGTAATRRRIFPIGSSAASAPPEPAPAVVLPPAGAPLTSAPSAGDPAGEPAPAPPRPPRTRRTRTTAPPAPPAPVLPRPTAIPHESLPEDIARVVRAVRTPTLWVDDAGRVLWAHPAMEALRVVRRRGIRLPEVAAMLDQARATDTVVDGDVPVKRPGRRQPRLTLRVRVAPMLHGSALILVEDVTEAERLDRVRRDFVANVSHELKTPIGALSLLAEAVAEATEDPDAVRRFAARMVTETSRLTTLVNDLMDLSRLEGIDPLHPMAPVSVDAVVDQACDDTRLMAQEKGIQFLRGGVTGIRVMGVEAQLVTALRNLLSNAISYSPPATKVAVTTAVAEGSVTIAVTDQGIGIPLDEQDRIFERFYRVDQARSRHTGGTGLGLAIVKHVCANHGGACDVWSRVGDGSTFTMRLPELGEHSEHSKHSHKEGTA